MSDPVTGPVSEDEAPRLRIVKGDPTPEEVAALVAVVAAIGAAQAADKPKARSEWASHHRKVRTPLTPGWRSSALPR
jgi:hypothetical protein